MAAEEAYVWIWLPDATEPVVAGLLTRTGSQLIFNYGRSYLARKDAISIYEPELPLRPGALPLKAGLAARNRRQIKLFAHQRHDQARQVIPRHVVLHARRQKLRLIHLPGPKVLAHGADKNQNFNRLTSDFSDRLLGGPFAKRCVDTAVSKVLSASWQRNRVHFMRSVVAHAGRNRRRLVSAFIAFAQDDPEAAKIQWRMVADQIPPNCPSSPFSWPRPRPRCWPT